MWHVVTSYGDEYQELAPEQKAAIRSQFGLTFEDEAVVTYIQFVWLP